MARRGQPEPAGDAAGDVVVTGVRPTPLRDLYHGALRASWLETLAAIVALFVILNLSFASAYVELGGIAHAEPGSFLDAFFFSVQTFGTIGYGAMYPETPLANAVVVSEAIVSLLFTAIATGLVFAKFSQPTSRIGFSHEAAISPMNGVPTLAFRVGNQRGNTVAEATIRVSVVRTERTTEGVLMYRMYDLRLVRDRSPALARSWNVLHTIDEASPLFGATPERFEADEVELLATIVGTDDTSMQPVHARHRYLAKDIVWGARHADILSERPDGKLQLDVTRFHDLVPTEPTASFPHRWEPGPR